jgi:ABC-type amino acid transport substrate-binding protein
VRRTGFWALALALGAAVPACAEDETLRVCLDANVPIYSVHRGGKSSGFDLAVSQALARRLGRGLAVQWFESKIDPDESSVLSANALLSDGRCQLVAGFPLVKERLGKPGTESAKMPDFEGATISDRRRRVMPGTLVATRAYHFAPLTLVLGPSATKPVASLADLKDMKIGIEAATLGDAILMLYDGGALVEQITHLRPGRNELLPGLEQGAYDATLIQLRSFDAYRAEHPETKVKPTGWYHRIGFNMGFVGLATDMALIEQANQAIADMLEKNELAPLAREAGMTYLPPRQPEILEHLTLGDLREN